MRKHYLVLTVVATLACQPVLSETYTGDIDVIHATPGYVQLNPGISVLPGESMTFSVTGQVDINHEYFEVKRCKWLGLKCWYEPRSIPHFRNADEFKVTLRLRSFDGSFEQVFERAADSSDPITVKYPISNRGSLTNPAELTGMIELHGVIRTPCTGRPRYCSSGALKLVSIDDSEVEPRLVRIRQELRDGLKYLDPVLVRSDVFVDPLLIDSADRRRKLQRVFAEELERESPSETERGFARSLVDIAKFAIGLHEDPKQVTKLNNVILQAYVALGDWSRIKDEGGKSLQSAKELCQLSGPPENVGNPDEGCRDYARMLKLNAVAWLEQKARYSSTEIRVALGLLEQAIAALDESRLKSVDNCRAYEAACELLGELYVDGARMLTVIRTSAELRKAEEWLTSAVDIHRTIDRANDL